MHDQVLPNGSEPVMHEAITILEGRGEPEEDARAEEMPHRLLERSQAPHARRWLLRACQSPEFLHGEMRIKLASVRGKVSGCLSGLEVTHFHCRLALGHLLRRALDAGKEPTVSHMGRA